MTGFFDGLNFLRGYPTKPRPAKPSNIIAQVEGSGIVEGSPIEDMRTVGGRRAASVDPSSNHPLD
jgi:hypothetical protein